MKFIKEDGTIEDGMPISDGTLMLRGHLQDYLHHVVCANTYHSIYEKAPVCMKAATFLAFTVNNNQDDPADYSVAVEKEVLRLTQPEPLSAGSVAAVAPGLATA